MFDRLVIHDRFQSFCSFHGPIVADTLIMRDNVQLRELLLQIRVAINRFKKGIENNQFFPDRMQ